MKITTYALAIALGVFSLVAPRATRADQIVDQANTISVETLFQNVGVFSPIGQSFSPTLSSLNFVDLLTQGGIAPYTFEVLVRSGSISGAILGTSEATTIVPPSPLVSIVTPFTFSAPVALVPGDLYVMQVVAVSGDAAVGSTDTNSYAGGTQILSGVAQPDNDLWFQEGINTSEPGTLGMLALGMMGILWFRKRTGVGLNSRAVGR